MADTTQRPKRGPSDPADYSSTQAPETQDEAEGGRPEDTDPRLQPGGPRGTPADPGMSSLDRDETISGGRSTGQTDFSQPPATRTD